ncbi:MAG: enoyl-CoA hydratase/isomerase family protein [Bacillota bacterium]
MEEYILLSLNNKVSTITLNRPQALNAIDATLLRQLNEALAVVSKDNSSNALIITGGDSVFAAGADLKAFQNYSTLQAHDYIDIARESLEALYNFPKPTIAAINGLALGGGCEIAIACDFRIAASNSRFGLPEINLGLLPAGGGTQRLPQLVGVSKAKEMIYTGSVIDSKTALSIGLVDRVVDPHEVYSEAQKMAERLADKPRIALKMIKEAIQTGLKVDLNISLLIEQEKFSLLFDTADSKEGIAAFLEKRQAVFNRE